MGQRTATSSALDTRLDIPKTMHHFKIVPLDKHKSSPIVTGLSDSPDTAKDPKPSKFSLQTVERLPMIRLPPKTTANEDFSFKGSSTSSRDKEKEPNIAINANNSICNNSEVNVQKINMTSTAYFGKKGSLRGLENKSFEKNTLVQQLEFSNSSFRNSEVLDTKIKPNEEQPSGQKVPADMAFSFMNLRLENTNQQNIFGAEESKQTGDKQFHSPVIGTPFVFGMKANEPETIKETYETQERSGIPLSESSVLSRSIASTARANHSGEKDSSKKFTLNPQPEGVVVSMYQESLNFIEVPQEAAKDKLFPHSQPTITTSTNVASQATVSSLANVCRDESRRITVASKFTTNLVDLVKPPSFSNLKQPKLNNWKSLAELPEEIQNKGYSRLNPKIASMSNLQAQNRPRLPSSSKVDMRLNLIGLAKEDEEDEEDEEDDFEIRFNPLEDLQERYNKNDKSLDLQGLELSEESDNEGPSPVATNSVPTITRVNTPNAPILSYGNSSFTRQVEGSVIFDKTIYNLDENINKMDLSKYSFYEKIEHVEVDERSNINTSNQTSFRILDSNQLDTSSNILYDPRKKTKSAVLDSNEGDYIVQPSTLQNKILEDRLRMRPKSISDVDKGKTLDQQRSLSPYLSPAMIPSASLTNIPYERSQMKVQRNSSVIETTLLDKSVDEEGQKKINQYMLIKDLGR